MKVAGITVTDKNGAKLQSDQITYSYQWFYKLGDNSFTIIEGAGSTYTIPKDAIEKDIKKYCCYCQSKSGSFFCGI